MAVSLSLRARQAQVFRHSQIVDVLRLSSGELEEHLSQASRDNPLLILRRQSSAGMSATDLIEMKSVQDTTSLYDHAMQELSGLIAQGGMLAVLVVAMIEELEPSGWLGCSIDQISDRAEVSSELVEAALKLVQRQIEPAGLFARNLEECLRLQLEDQGALDADMEKVLTHLSILESGGPACLAKVSGLEPARVEASLALIRRLNPKPGSDFTSDPALLREPDVVVSRRGANWHIEFSNPVIAEVEMAPLPRGKKGGSELAKARDKARSLKEALELRQSAIRKIVQVLVNRQGGYFAEGETALEPLTMTEVAEVAGFHASTVSRVLNGLLIEGPHGVILAKTLCPGAVAVQSAHSKPKVQARIRQMVSDENPASPMTDRALVAALAADGIKVSRRVVSNYRQALGIDPASKRRQTR